MPSISEITLNSSGLTSGSKEVRGWCITITGKALSLKIFSKYFHKNFKNFI